MPEVKFVIKSEADLKGIESTTASLNKLAAAERNLQSSVKDTTNVQKVDAEWAARRDREHAKQAASAARFTKTQEGLKASISEVSVEQYNLDAATVGTARAMGKAADETTKAATAKRGMIPLLGMIQKGAMAAGAGIGFLGRSVGALKIALLSTGWGIFLGAIGAVVGWIIKLATTSDTAKESVDKLTAKVNAAAEAQFEFAKGTKEATAALGDQDQAEISRISDVENAKLDASQRVESAQLEARIDSGELSGDDAIRARAGLTQRHAGQRETLNERLRQARETALGRTARRTGADIAVAQGELAAAQAGAQPMAFEQLPPHQQALMRAGLLTPEMLAGRQQTKISSAEANLAAIQSGAAPVLEGIRQEQMNIGAERTVAGIRSGASAEVSGIEMAGKLEVAEINRTREAVKEAQKEVTDALKAFAAEAKLINSRSRNSR